MEKYPALVNGILTVVFMVVGPFLIRHGITQEGAQAAIESLIGGVLGIVALWRVWVTHTKVTPVANPKDNDGTPLVRKAA